MLGQSVRLQPVAIQNLSELERARLQKVALHHLEERELDFKISIPTETRKRRKSLRRKFDSFSKEKKERECCPMAFGLPLSQVICNDQALKRRQDNLKQSRRDCLDLEDSVLRFRAEKKQFFFNGTRALVGSSSTIGTGPASPSFNSVGPMFEQTHIKPASPTFRDNSRGQRRGGLSVDSISDLVDSQSRLLEALQLSHPAELDMKKSSSATRTQTKLSLNPIYRQVPQVVEKCCAHIQNHGLQTVGIFRVGSSKKRVRQLREAFDVGVDVQLEAELSVHDVAALLKEFLRDLPDPLLPRELYPAFLHSNLLTGTEQLHFLQHLLYLLPPCNCDTLLRILSLLHTVQSYANDSIGTNDEEIPGNKMTAANLAVIFGPNLLQGEHGGGDASPHMTVIEDSAVIINVMLLLIQNYRKLFMVSPDLQQEVLMSLIQTDPDVIDYLLRRKLSNSSCLTQEGNSRTSVDSSRDTETTLDAGGVSSDSGRVSPLTPPSPLFPPDANGGEGGLTSEVFFNVLKLNQNRQRQENHSNGEVSPRKSIHHLRHFHSHHNLLSLVSSSSSSDQQGAPHPTPSPLDSPRVWVQQNSLDQKRTSSSSSSHFWDFFTGKPSGSETTV